MGQMKWQTTSQIGEWVMKSYKKCGINNAIDV